MSLLRHPRTSPPPAPESPVHQKIDTLESEIRALRPSRPPSAPPVVVPIDRSERALFLMAELARQQVAVARLDDARRTLADALLVLDEITDEHAIARASVLLAE